MVKTKEKKNNKNQEMKKKKRLKYNKQKLTQTLMKDHNKKA